MQLRGYQLVSANDHLCIFKEVVNCAIVQSCLRSFLIIWTTICSWVHAGQGTSTYEGKTFTPAGIRRERARPSTRLVCALLDCKWALKQQTISYESSSSGLCSLSSCSDLGAAAVQSLLRAAQSMELTALLSHEFARGSKSLNSNINQVWVFINPLKFAPCPQVARIQFKRFFF
jgi:hypothetical protein